MKRSPRASTVAVEDWVQRAEEFARREPAKAVVSALGVGFLLNRLPLGAIAGALVHISFTLLRPALLVIGLLKASEFLRTNTVTHHE